MKKLNKADKIQFDFITTYSEDSDALESVYNQTCDLDINSDITSTVQETWDTRFQAWD